MADPVKDASDWLSKQDPEWRKKVPAPKAPSSLEGLKTVATEKPKSADEVTSTAESYLKRRFGAK